MLTSIFSLVAVVIKGLMISKSKFLQNYFPVVYDGHVKYEKAEVDILLAIYKTNSSAEGVADHEQPTSARAA